MLDLDKKIFGKITTKEIIGATPTVKIITKLLDAELITLTESLKSCSKQELEDLQHLASEARRHINSRPGAMALAQDKIKLYNMYNEKLVKLISAKLATL